jgi:proteic killer suppression protein
MRHVTHYINLMIASFKSKALSAFWEKGKSAKLDARMLRKIADRLISLDEATKPDDMDVDGYDFHGLKGDRAGTYTVHVNGPWCITFQWEAADAVRVDLEQYH